MSLTAGGEPVPAGAELTEQWAGRFAEFGHEAVERTLLRTRSRQAREVLARSARSDGYARTLQIVREGGLEVIPQHRWLESLALVVGMQDLDESDTADACALYRALTLTHGARWLGVRHRIAYAELLLIAGEVDQAAQLVTDALEGADEGKFLRLDVNNPVHGGDPAVWSEAWRAQFQARGLPAPTVDETAASRFDGLIAPAVAVRTGGPFVSVVMTAFRPGVDLLVAARSILTQSWRNLELIVVDDASGPEFDDALRAVAALDERVRVVRLERNGGTYRARNVGIELARGSIVAGMDSDDWSHPLRLELQLRPLLDDTNVVATRCRAWTVSPALQLHRRGFWPERWCEGSLMFRRDDVRALGGFVGSRRSADSELVGRLRAARKHVVDVPLPLWITRITPDTLSRADFRAGWHHPARLAMRASWESWHAGIRRGDTSPFSDGTLPRVPARLAFSRGEERSFDLVVAADWRFDTPSVRQWQEIVQTAARTGMRVALTQLDDPWNPVKTMWGPTSAAASVNAGVVEFLTQDEDANARLLVVAEPRTLVLLDRSPSGLRPARVAVVGGPRDAAGGWGVADCETVSRAVWGDTPTWLPRSAQARAEIAAEGGQLHEPDLVPSVDVTAWRPQTPGRHRRPAVVGAMVTQVSGRWTVPPGVDDGPVAGAVGWAVERMVEGRIEGVSPNIVLFRDGELGFHEFLAQIDLLILGPEQEDAERVALECAAAGVVATSLSPRATPGVVGWESLRHVWSDVRALDDLRVAAVRAASTRTTERSVDVLRELCGVPR